MPEAENARGRADEVRARAAIVHAVFAPLGSIGVWGVAVAATAIILNTASPATHVLLLAVVWVCSALVCLALIAVSVLLSCRVRWLDLTRSPPVEPPLPPQEVERLSRAFQK